MPEEVIIIFFVMVILPITMTKMILNHKYRKMKLEKEAKSNLLLDPISTTTESENSLTTSELKTLIEQAVTKANVPLTERLEALEQQVNGANASLPLEVEEELEEVSDYMTTKTLGRSRHR